MAQPGFVDFASRSTGSTGFRPASANPARRLLDAARGSDLEGFERELRRARLVASQPRTAGTEAAERWELLEAIAGDLDQRIGRAHRGQPSEAAPLEADFTLLKHLARPRPFAGAY